MEKLLLPLRQRKLLNYLQHASGYLTGVELSKRLDVSSRTIRNDISEINRLLQGTGIEISSKHSFGYIIHSQNADNLKKLIQTSESFISRSERLHHIAQRLALADTPIDLDDLADEMFISKTTLEYDLKEFRQQYVLSKPFIHIYRHHNTIELPSDERMRRKMLCHLVCENWNYNERGNTFFQYSFLNEKNMNICIQEIGYYLDKYNICIEDINIINLDLCTAIASERIRNGYTLTDKRHDLFLTKKASICVDELLDKLEDKLNCHFCDVERDEIRELLSCSILPDVEKITSHGISNSVPAEITRLTNDYLAIIEETYGLNFSNDGELYLTLILYLKNLQLPIHNLNTNGIIRSQIQILHAIGFELAMLIQPQALKFYGHYLSFDELFYLSTIMDCAFSRLRPPILRTVILSQYNHPLTWSLRMMIEKRFPNDIHVTNLLSMYEKDTFDFSKTDLILCTTNKIISSDTPAYQIQISPYCSDTDIHYIQDFLNKSAFNRLYQHNFPNIFSLLEHAHWNELLETDNYFDVLKYLGNKLIDDGYVGEDYLEDIWRHEKLLPFTVDTCFTIVHSTVPAKKTHIEIATMLHRLKIDNNKIRMVIMICMTPEDRGLIFKLYNELYFAAFNPEDTRFLKRKEEYLNFFRNQSGNNE